MLQYNPIQKEFVLEVTEVLELALGVLQLAVEVLDLVLGILELVLEVLELALGILELVFPAQVWRCCCWTTSTATSTTTSTTVPLSVLVNCTEATGLKPGNWAIEG